MIMEIFLSLHTKINKKLGIISVYVHSWHIDLALYFFQDWSPLVATTTPGTLSANALCEDSNELI